MKALNSVLKKKYIRKQSIYRQLARGEITENKDNFLNDILKLFNHDLMEKYSINLHPHQLTTISESQENPKA